MTTKVDADVLLCRHYFAALTDKDWDGLGALCHRDVVYSLRGTSPLSQEVRGRDAFIEMSREVFAQFRSAKFEDVFVKAMAGSVGIYVTTYRSTWETPSGESRSDNGRVVLHIVRDKIVRIAVLLSDEQLESITKDWTTPAE